MFKRARCALCLSTAIAVTLSCAGNKPPPADISKEINTNVRLAQGYLRSGRTSQAMLAMEEAIKLDPKNAGLKNFYGQILLVSGRFEEAEAALDHALELDPYLSDAHNNRGALYAETGRPAKAEQDFREALKDRSYPTPQKVYFNLGTLYSSQQRNLEAIESLRKAVEIDRDYYQAHFELAGVLDSQGSLEEAAREYEVALPGYRTSGEYHYRIGFVYFRLGNHPRATQELNRVLDLAPGTDSAVRASEILKLIGKS
jgi:type IV pilus biogenesis/stability protein PilW